jgi:hypothetical protein
VVTHKVELLGLGSTKVVIMVSILIDPNRYVHEEQPWKNLEVGQLWNRVVVKATPLWTTAPAHRQVLRFIIDEGDWC